jgi:hypothetical protein
MVLDAAQAESQAKSWCTSASTRIEIQERHCDMPVLHAVRFSIDEPVRLRAATYKTPHLNLLTVALPRPFCLTGAIPQPMNFPTIWAIIDL